jgi:hypothetical protein
VNAWLVLLGTAIGAAGSILAGWLSSRSLSDRERAARREDHETALAVQRAEFQRETLIALQDALARLVTATVDYSFQTSGAPNPGLSTGLELEAAWRSARFDGLTFGTRAADDEVRESTNTALGLSDKVRIATEYGEAQRRLERFHGAANAATNRAGEILRDLHP